MTCDALLFQITEFDDSPRFATEYIPASLDMQCGSLSVVFPAHSSSSVRKLFSFLTPAKEKRKKPPQNVIKCFSGTFTILVICVGCKQLPP